MSARNGDLTKPQLLEGTEIIQGFIWEYNVFKAATLFSTTFVMTVPRI